MMSAIPSMGSILCVTRRASALLEQGLQQHRHWRQARHSRLAWTQSQQRTRSHA